VPAVAADIHVPRPTSVDAVLQRLSTWSTDFAAGSAPATVKAIVGEIVQRRAKLAGLEGDFGGHSLRSGFVTEASRQGVPLPAIMAMTEYRAVSSVMGYFQTGNASTNSAARLLEDSQ